jgi:hypothetical protein
MIVQILMKTWLNQGSGVSSLIMGSGIEEMRGWAIDDDETGECKTWTKKMM